MKISYNWLKEYIGIEMQPQDLSKVLTSIGLEVESAEDFESVRGGLRGVVIGEVITCERHPNADKLSVTTVNVGGPQLLHVVCGASNVRAGLKVPIATIGTTIYSGAEPFIIKQAKIRGELSEGMLCGQDELGLGTDHSGIMELEASCIPGTLASDYFGITSDTVFEIGLTPNRIDSASHYGVARDLSAYFRDQKNIVLHKPEINKFSIDSKIASFKVFVENTEACPRYSGISISGIKVKESPDWLKKRLLAIGMNPINNVVDVTNFILHEIGQPLHAFDASKIKDHTIIVKNAEEGLVFKTLDGIEHNLKASDLIIADSSQPLALAGILGGLNSGISDSTTELFLESAYFNPVNVRRTAKRLGLSTDSSFRFERGTDPAMPLFALKRAAALIREVAGGKIVSDVIDVYPVEIKEAVFTVSLSYIKMLIGKEIPSDTIKQILQALEIVILKEQEDVLEISVPAYRVDVKRPADIVEEILRIYGYNNVEISSKINASITYSEKPDHVKLRNKISDILSSNGFNEIMCNSLTRYEHYDLLDEEAKDRVVKILNPLSNDLNAIRNEMVFGFLETVIHNINRQNSDLRIYEFGNVYKLHEGKDNKSLSKYVEVPVIGMLVTGNKTDANWIAKDETADFFHLKGFLENIFGKLGISVLSYCIEEHSNAIFAQSLKYTIGKNILAEVGVLQSKLVQAFDIKQSVYYAEIHWAILLELVSKVNIQYKELPRFPEVHRDLALLLDSRVSFGKIKDLAFKSEKSLLRSVNLFDVFENEEKLGKGKKSYAVNFVLQDAEKTLTDEKVDKIMNNLIKVYEKELNAQIR